MGFSLNQVYGTKLTFGEDNYGVKGLYHTCPENVEKYKELVKQHKIELLDETKLKLYGRTLKEWIREKQVEIDSLMQMESYLKLSGHELVPLFKGHLDNVKLLTTRNQSVVDAYDGTDPLFIMNVVNRCLEVCLEEKVEHIEPTELEKEHFKLMKESGLVVMENETYDPSIVMRDLVAQNPQIDKLLLGCGKKVLACEVSCFYCEKTKDDHDKAFTIDMGAYILPDVVASFHEANIWKNIPDERFGFIADHTNGDYLLGDPKSFETLKSIYRALKKGGEFKMDRPLNVDRDKDKIEMLKRIGFIFSDRVEVVQSGDQEMHFLSRIVKKAS